MSGKRSLETISKMFVLSFHQTAYQVNRAGSLVRRSRIILLLSSCRGKGGVKEDDLSRLMKKLAQK